MTPPHYDPRRDAITGLLNPVGLRDYAHLLGDATAEVLDGGDVPVGLEVTIFNPRLDADGSIARALVRRLARSLNDV